MSTENETPLAEAIRDWAGHQDYTQPGSRRCKRHVDALLQQDPAPDLTGVQSAVAELYHLQHSYKNQNYMGMSPRRRECLKQLLALGLNPAQVDAAGDTLLHLLCRFDAPLDDIRLLMLLKHGANPGIGDQDGVTPQQVLRVKSSRLPTADELAELLLQHNNTGPDIPGTGGKEQADAVTY